MREHPDFPFKPGDRVSCPDWAPDHYVTITTIGQRLFLATSSYDGVELSFPIDGGPWILVPPPVERYTVEIRPAQPGEQHLYAEVFYWGFGDRVKVRTNDNPAATTCNCIVIVETSEVYQ